MLQLESQSIRILSLQISILLLQSTFSVAQSPSRQPPPLLQLNLQSAERYVGLPILWNPSEAVLLEPTGRMHYVSQAAIVSHKLLERTFHPQSVIEASRLLQQELGSNFEVLIHESYVVAAPTNQAGRWRDRFQSLLAGYTRYFEVRGWPMRQPDFPLIVVVFPNRIAFQRYLANESAPTPDNVVGSYFPRSNRCVLYQLAGAVGVDWSETEATIVHEAVHQLAFNTGVHERLAENPLWLVEGFATMFEQPAVYDLRVNRSSVESRMLVSKVQQLQPILREPGGLESRLHSMLECDRIFQEDPLAAYTVAWALTFYLSERMPSQFADYLQIQTRRGISNYSSEARVTDFHRAFHIDSKALAIQIQRLFQQ